MAIVSLDDNQKRTRFFHEAVLLNLNYWLGWLASVKDTDIETLDIERDNLVKAILIGLQLEKPAWSTTQQLITNYAPYMERRGQWDIWRMLLHEAINVAEKIGDHPKAATLSVLLARLLYRQSEFRQSTAFYRRAIRISRQLGDDFEEARACTNLGFFFVEQECWYRAEVLCCHALTIFQQIGNHHGMAHTESHLGFLYTQQRLFDQAKHHLNQAYAIWQEMRDEPGLMLAAMNLGILYLYQQRPNEALTYFKQALKFANQTGEEQEPGAIHLNLGMTYLQMGNLAQAETHSLKAEAILRQYSDKFGLANVHENLGKIYLEMKDWQSAGDCLETALQSWRMAGNKRGIVQTAIYLAEYELAQNHRCIALDWLSQAENLLKEPGKSITFHQLTSQINDFRHSLENS
jgi:tetratricopeptide (TPR) repeat protein